MVTVAFRTQSNVQDVFHRLIRSKVGKLCVPHGNCWIRPGKNPYNYLRWFFLLVKNQLILNAFVPACLESVSTLEFVEKVGTRREKRNK